MGRVHTFYASLFCRKLSLISYPASCQLKCHYFLKIMQRFKHLLQGHLLLCSVLPCWLVECPKYQVIIANDFWLLLTKKGGKKMFHIILMSNKQITVWAIAASLVEREYLHWVY